MPESGSGANDDAGRIDALDRARLIRRLKDVLAIAGDAATSLRSFVLLGQQPAYALTELQNALAQADRLADSLRKESRARKPTVPTDDVIHLDEFLAVEQAELRAALEPAVVLRLALSAPDGTVRAAREDLRQLIRVLVDTASRNMFTGGVLTISTSWVETLQPGAAIAPTQSQRYVRLSVSDGGELTTGGESTVLLLLVSAASRIGLPDESISLRVHQLQGWTFAETFNPKGTRVHVCLPALEPT